MVEDQSFEVLENSENSKSGATPSASMVLRAKERVKTLWAHSDELIANLKQHVDQFKAQDNPLDLTENQVENQDFGSVKVFDVCFFSRNEYENLRFVKMVVTKPLFDRPSNLYLFFQLR